MRLDSNSWDDERASKTNDGVSLVLTGFCVGVLIWTGFNRKFVDAPASALTPKDGVAPEPNIWLLKKKGWSALHSTVTGAIWTFLVGSINIEIGICI